MRNLKYFSYLFILFIAVFIISCEKDDNSIIDPILKFPVINNAEITPDSVNSGNFSTTAFATVTSEDPVGRVFVLLRDPDNNEIHSIDLNDNGVSPDVTAGDGKFSGTITYTESCIKTGNYSAIFLAQTAAGLNSPEVTEQFRVVNINNQPPVASNLSIMPDSIKYGDTSLFIFQITAEDLDGQCDLHLQSVYYDGFRPSGISLTRQYLYDDGSCCLRDGALSGDDTAGDKIYTRIFEGTPPELGYFKYYLKAVDRSGASSNILSDSIYVYP